MKQLIHAIAAVVAAACITTFFVSTVLVELLGNTEDVATVKSLIVIPGLFILVPAIAITGMTGFLMASHRKDAVVSLKKKRMPLIAANGVLILVPAAVYLNLLAAAGNFGLTFYLVQGVELLAGLANIVLISLNMRDGLRLSGRLRRSRKTPVQSGSMNG